ncbi:MAG: RNA polymerase-binding protein RpbA [Cetobacterium sp.]|uniref:RNA polymerase-binding protein RpbA n=1 Tax=Cetobacterium sp. TaxID=2071632 RepID=UPI003EE5D1D8
MSAKAFDYTNKIRQAWIPMVKGTKLDVKLAYFDREDRFETYREIDRDVHDKVVEMMRSHYEEMIEQGNVTKTCTLGHFTLTKEAIRGLDYYIAEAANIVIAEMISELESM